MQGITAMSPKCHGRRTAGAVVLQACPLARNFKSFVHMIRAITEIIYEPKRILMISE